MLKRILLSALGLILFLTSCQNRQSTDVVNTVDNPTATAQPNHPTETLQVAPSPTSKFEGEAESTQTVLPISTGTSARCFVSSTEHDPFAFMPDSVRLLIKERSGVTLFNLETLKAEQLYQAPQNLFGVALSPDGELLAWSLEDSSIQLIHVTDGKVVNTMKEHTLPVTKLRFSSTGDRLFSASMDTWVRVWDRNGKQLDAFQPSGADNIPNDVEGMGISPDGTMLGSIPFDGPTRVWNLADKKELANLGETGGDVTSDFAFSPDGQFAAADPISHLSLWRTSDWKKILSGVHSMAFAFSPDGRFLAYHDIDDKHVYLRSLAEPQKISDLEGSPSFIYDLFFSPDGTLLASAGAGIQIWQVDTGQLMYVGKDTCP